MNFKILLCSIYIELLTEIRHSVGVKSDASVFNRMKIVFSNPLKYARSFFYNGKVHKGGSTDLITRSIREGGDATRSLRLHHHYILIHKPSHIPCSHDSSETMNKSVVWKHLNENRIIQTPGHKMDSNGYLNIGSVGFSDMGDYTCLIPGNPIKVYAHRVTVISIPKIRIEVQMRYTTSTCEDSIRITFERAIIKLLGHQVCYTSTCHIMEVEASCQHNKKKRDLFFETKIILTVFKAPTTTCGIVCTSQNLEHETSEIRQAIKQDILKYGEITLPSGTFHFKPKVLIYFSMNFYCDLDFVLSSDYCEPCKPGTVFNVNKCHPCPMDSYNPHFGSRQCYACPIDKETFVEGANSIEQCVERNNRASTIAILVFFCMLAIKIIFLVGIKMYFSKKKAQKIAKAKEKFSESHLQEDESTAEEDDENSTLSSSSKSAISLISTDSENSYRESNTGKNKGRIINKKRRANKEATEAQGQSRTNEKGTCTNEDAENCLKIAESGAHPIYVKKHAKKLKSDVLMSGPSMSTIVPLPPPLPGKQYRNKIGPLISI